MHRIEPVIDSPGIQTVVALANKIWNQHFVDIIGQAQVDYMLRKFQTEEAITEQIAEGYQYYLLYYQDLPVGYLSIRPDEAGNKMMISKIYVDAENRGAGHGRFLLDFVVAESQGKSLTTIWLTVNRYNSDTVNWYKRRGFATIDEVKIDIGEGFYMDDFVMEMSLN